MSLILASIFAPLSDAYRIDMLAEVLYFHILLLPSLGLLVSWSVTQCKRGPLVRIQINFANHAHGYRNSVV